MSGTKIKLFLVYHVKLDTVIIDVMLVVLQNKRHCIMGENSAPLNENVALSFNSTHLSLLMSRKNKSAPFLITSVLFALSAFTLRLRLHQS